MAGTGEYTAADIQVLTSLEAVRKRPGMYIGDVVSPAALHLLLWEVVGNALDEYVAGHARTIAIHVDGERVIIEDDGRGIPHDRVERVFTTLHAGTAGKRPHRHLALDLHATGVAVTNFLARTFEVTTWRDGQAVRQGFAQGVSTGIELLGPASGSGTRIAFEPDFTILKQQPWDTALIRDRCRELAGIEPGLRIELGGDTYCYASLGDYLRAGRDMIDPLDVNVVENEIGVRVALGWHDGERSIRTLVNGSPSSGVQLTAFRRAIETVFERRLGRRIAKRELERGMLAVLHVTLDAPRWSDPTKEWLGNDDVATAVRAVVERELARHLDETPALLDALLLRWEARARRGAAPRSV